VDLDKVESETLGKNIRELIRLGFLVSLDGNIILHREVYDNLKTRIMGLFAGKDKVTIPEAKDATGLSRKFIIPLLNRIESDGLIKRIGDFRIKA
jgi:selenocysteine-specific elongation factor